MAKIQFLSLLIVLSAHSTFSTTTTGRPQAADLQEQLDNFTSQLEQFRLDVSSKLDESVSVRLERLERKLEEFTSTTTTPTTDTTETGANETSVDINATTSFPKLPAAAWAEIAESNFEKSNGLLEQLGSSAGQNSVFSAVSLSLTLLMARFGAVGRTKTELDTVLRVPPQFRQNDRATQAGPAEFMGSLRDPVQDYNVTLAKKMYVMQGLEISPEYETVVRQVFDAEVEPLDFADGQRAAEAINSWVEAKTDGKIRQPISTDALNASTKLVLVNAMHFRSPWQYKFEVSRTQKQLFHVNASFTTEVDMMFSSDQYSSAELPELNAKLVVIPYKGGRFSMHVIIPNEIEGLEDLLQDLRNITIGGIRSKIQRPGHCDTLSIRLPKFKIESTLNLAEPLKRMGARALFSATDADLSGISEEGELYVSDVIQKAYIEVDEEGSEAVAATVIKTELTCVGQTREMTADRPFYFQIIDEDRNLIMFTGVIFDPNA